MDTRWTKKAKTPEEKKKRKEQVESFKKAFTELDKILDSMVKELKVEDYSSPSWAYLRADTDGYNRAIQAVKQLIKE